MTVTYLMKENDELCSHCDCSEAYVTFPGQMDCPWCGCGWLFSCADCRRAFTFAKGVEVDLTWQDLALRDLVGRWTEEPEEDDVQQWIEAMQEMLSHIEVGERYVYLDGMFVPAEAMGLEFDGWFAHHDLDFIPQIEALEDPAIVEKLLANPDYWQKNALSDDEQ